MFLIKPWKLRYNERIIDILNQGLKNRHMGKEQIKSLHFSGHHSVYSTIDYSNKLNCFIMLITLYY